MVSYIDASGKTHAGKPSGRLPEIPVYFCLEGFDGGWDEVESFRTLLQAITYAKKIYSEATGRTVSIWSTKPGEYDESGIRNPIKDKQIASIVIKEAKE